MMKKILINIRFYRLFQFSVISIVLLSGCAVVPQTEKPDTAEFAPVEVSSKSRQPLSAGSLFSAEVGVNLYDDRRAYRAGDIITVTLNERTVSSKSAETKIDKDGTVEFGEDSILGRLVDIKGNSLLTNVDQTRSFDGSGETDQQNRLQAVLPSPSPMLCLMAYS